MRHSFKGLWGIFAGLCLITLFQNCSGGFEAGGTGELTSSSSSAPTLTVQNAPSSLTNSRNVSVQISVAVNGLATVKKVTCTLDTNVPVECKNSFTATGLADGDHTLNIEAVDSLNNISNKYVAIWKVDGTAPIVTYSQTPPAITGSTAVTAAFAANEISTYECSLDAAAFTTCVSPLNLTALSETTHTLRIHAKDSAGNVSADATSTFKIDQTAPALTLLTKPATPSNANSATFTFNGTDNGMVITVFSCQLDAQPVVACNAGTVTYSNLGNGPHTFKLTGQDSAGNMSAATNYTWTVDLTPPSLPVIVANVTSPSKSASATFQFSSNDASGIKNYVCQLDTAASETCAPAVAKTYSGLTSASHVFKVHAVDQAGNASAVASFNWVVDLSVPTPTPTTMPPNPGGSLANCGMQGNTSAVAFCDTFDKASPITNRSGQLDNTVWGVSRTYTAPSYWGAAWPWGATEIELCGGIKKTVIPPYDVQVCDGQMREATNDNLGGTWDAGGVLTLAMYPKQPFDFFGRVGTVAFDVSNDTAGNHAAWPEFWMSDQPVPAPFSHFGSWVSVPQNGFGIRLAAACQPGNACVCPETDPQYRFTVESATVIRDWVVEDNVILTGNPAVDDKPFGNSQCNNFGNQSCVDTGMNVKVLGCVRQPDPNAGPNGKLNHVEFKISQNQIDVYATDAGTTAPLKHIAVITKANLTFSRGFAWMEHAHYNADKGDLDHPSHVHAPDFNGILRPTQRIHTFTWDNFAFDGPILPRDLSYDVLDGLTPINFGVLNNVKNVDLGWAMTATQRVVNLKTLPVDVIGMVNAKGAFLLFNFWKLNEGKPTFTYTINGHSHTAAWPFPDGQGNTGRTIALPVPLSDIVPGVNQISITASDLMNFSNVNLNLQGAGGIVNPPKN